MKMSSIYETAPVGYLNQDAFLNLVIRLETSLSPLSLLDTCQEIEQILQRERLIRWGPRTVDLDVLLYGQEQLTTERLIIPHPHMYERAFVLVPLRELMPALSLPEGLDTQEVELWKTYSDIKTFLLDAS